jgi:hypothetical protein
MLGHVADDEFLQLAYRKTPIVDEGPTFRICRDCNDCEWPHGAQIVPIAPSPELFPVRRTTLPLAGGV